MSSSVKPVVLKGGRALSTMVPLCQRLRFQWRMYWLAHTGTTGTPALIAIWKAPFLRGPRPLPWLRVPSANTQIDMSRSCSVWVMVVIARLADAALPRSSNTLPASQ